METKTMVVGAIALIAILIGAFILLSHPSVIPPQQGGNYSNPLGGQNASMDEFAKSLISAQNIYLVEDLRGLEKYPISRNNIMQCGVDFAGSEGLAGKEVNVYILEGDTCSASEAGANLSIKTISECHSKVASAFQSDGSAVIWIEKGYTPSVYLHGLVVRVNETYSQGMCNIRFAVPAPEQPPAVNQSPTGNETGAGSGTAVVPEGNTSGVATEEPPAAGASTTPPENTSANPAGIPPLPTVD